MVDILDYNEKDGTYLVAWEDGTDTWVDAADLSGSAFAVLAFHHFNTASVHPVLRIPAIEMVICPDDEQLEASVGFLGADEQSYRDDVVAGQRAITMTLQEAAGSVHAAACQVNEEVQVAPVLDALNATLARLLAIHDSHEAVTNRDMFVRLQELLQHDCPLSASDIGENLAASAWLRSTADTHYMVVDPCQFSRLARGKPPTGPLSRLAPTAAFHVVLLCFHPPFPDAGPGDVGHWTLLDVAFPGPGETQVNVQFFDSLSVEVKHDHIQAVKKLIDWISSKIKRRAKYEMAKPTTMASMLEQRDPQDKTCGVWMMMMMRAMLLGLQWGNTLFSQSLLPAMRAIMVLEALFRGQNPMPLAVVSTLQILHNFMFPQVLCSCECLQVKSASLTVDLSFQAAATTDICLLRTAF